MRADGKKIAGDIRARVRDALTRAGRRLILGVVSVGGDAVTEQFIRIKKRAAEDVGVAVVEKKLPQNVSTEDVLSALSTLCAETNGVIVQLPLPKHIDRENVLAAIPASHDVDCLGSAARAAFASGESPLLPPVVVACKEICERYSVSIAGKRVAVAGRGALVGAPAALWFKNNGGIVDIVDVGDDPTTFSAADIIVLGAGVPHFLKPGMIKDGAVILDAGTSESGGKVVGDADPACVEKASLVTPVPGGIGPIAVAKIFENLLVCTSISL